MKKISVLLVIFVLCFAITGCGQNVENNTNNDNSTNNETVKEEKKLSSIDDFKNEVKKLGIDFEETKMSAEYINAESGLKLTSDGKKLEVYKFDTNSEHYKTAEENQKVTMDGFGSFDAIVKNGYALMIDDNFPQYDKVIEIFNNLK